MNTSELIRSDNETVMVVRVDHGQTIVECVNAGEQLSPSGTAVEMFKSALVTAADDFLREGSAMPAGRQDDTLLLVQWNCGDPCLSLHPQSRNQDIRDDALDDLEACMQSLCVEFGAGSGLPYRRLNQLGETIRKAAREWQRLAGGMPHGDRPRSSVEQLRAKESEFAPPCTCGEVDCPWCAKSVEGACARHETADDCKFFGCGARRTPPPLELRLARLEAACAGIVRDHEFRATIAAAHANGRRDPSGDC